MNQEKFLSEKEKVGRLKKAEINTTTKKEITEDKGDKTPFFFLRNYIMSVKFHRIRKMMENYLNDFKKDEVETMYGKNSEIKIHTISFSITQKSVLIEAIIVLGDTINEEVLDRRLADYLIQDMIPYFFPEISSIKVMTRWDV